MDIFNRPPAIAEDTLQYVLHPGPNFSDKALVTTLATMIDSHVSSLLPNHIWHRDAFELKVVSGPKSPNQWTIEGLMRVGDCVDDEWCVVWLLRAISKQWDVVVSVFDSDGEFLLIEAAEYLPTWVTPENSENRVWIYEGHFHLVPLSHVSSLTTKRERRRLPGAGSDGEDGEDPQGDVNYISASDAIQIVRNPKMDTMASPDVENAAFRRIQGYPVLARQHLHRTKAYLPRDVALALSNNPTLVQKAAEAFYTRDAIQLRTAARMTRFPPDTSVLATVNMTRPAYAQLVGQKFHPPRVFGKWSEREGTPEWRWRDIGMKIACGFEMLYQESKGRHEVVNPETDSNGSSIEARKEALRRDPEYMKYIQNLQGAGYFKYETEGSALWKEQENSAAAQFIKSRQIDNANRPSFASLANSAVSRAQSQLGDTEFPDFVRGQEETDEWLTVDERTVDDMLANSNRPETASPAVEDSMDVDEGNQLEDKLAAEQAGRLRNLADKVEKFVEKKGDVEGATFEDDILSDGEDMSELSDSDDESTSDYRMDQSEHTTAVRQAAMDKLVPGLESSEYGKMPASFHANSQKVREATIGSEMAPVEEKPDASLHLKPIRPLIFPRDQFDGVEDSDDESEEEGAGEDEAEEDEDQPTVVGEVEVDMQEEEEEFLQFSREALGISPEMWSDIVRDRKGRGAFLPDSAFLEETEETKTTQAPSASKSRQTAADSRQGKSDSGPRPNGNPNLDSFEAVMQAMDAELSRAERNKQGGTTKSAHTKPQSKEQQGNKGKGKQKAADEDLETAMDAELRAVLEGGSDDDSEEGPGGEAPMDYTLIKNFLESFKSQHGLSGPVGNLVGRLQPGWQLPRDES